MQPMPLLFVPSRNFGDEMTEGLLGRYVKETLF